jgi:hypothetical protein
MADDLICPKCGKIDTSRDELHLKVSSVYTSGQATGTYTDLEGYHGYDHIQSQISQRLAPPQVPAQPWKTTTAIYGCSVLSNWVFAIGLSFLALYIWLVPSEDEPLPELVFSFIAICLLIAALRGPVTLNKQKYQWKERSGKAQIDLNLWNKLYYCKRHDIVFEADGSFNLPSDQLQNFWRESAK